MFYDGKYLIAKHKKHYMNYANNTNFLLGAILDVLNIANWQRTGKKNLRRPKSIFTNSVSSSTETKIYDGKIPLSEVGKYL